MLVAQYQAGLLTWWWLGIIHGLRSCSLADTGVVEYDARRSELADISRRELKKQGSLRWWRVKDPIGRFVGVGWRM